jgi:hypothetical protein
MNKYTDSSENIVSDDELNADFEYNFDLKPFNYVLDGIHWAVALPYSLLTHLFQATSEKLHRIQQDQAYRRTFKGPACILK